MRLVGLLILSISFGGLEALGCAGVVARQAPLAVATAFNAHGSFSVVSSPSGVLYQVRDGALQVGDHSLPQLSLRPVLPNLAPGAGTVREMSLRNLSSDPYTPVGLIAVLRSNGRVEVGSTLSPKTVPVVWPEDPEIRDLKIVALDSQTSRLFALDGERVFSADIDHSDRTFIVVKDPKLFLRLPPEACQSAGNFNFIAGISSHRVVVASETGWVYDNHKNTAQKKASWMRAFSAAQREDGSVEQVWTDGFTIFGANDSVGDTTVIQAALAHRQFAKLCYSEAPAAFFNEDSSEGFFAGAASGRQRRLLTLTSDGHLYSPWARNSAIPKPWSLSEPLGLVNYSDDPLLGEDAVHWLQLNPWVTLPEYKNALETLRASRLASYSRLAHLNQWLERRKDLYLLAGSPAAAAERVRSWGDQEQQLLTLELLSLANRRRVLGQTTADSQSDRASSNSEIARLRLALESPARERETDHLLELLAYHRGYEPELFIRGFKALERQSASKNLSLGRLLSLYLRARDPLWMAHQPVTSR